MNFKTIKLNGDYDLPRFHHTDRVVRSSGIKLIKAGLNIKHQRILSLGGMVAPVLFIFTAVLGGAMRPGYSHVANTVSELFSPGSPNKPLLDSLHATFSLLLILFGIGLLQYFRTSRQSALLGVIGAWLYLAMAMMSLATAAIFPQDPWGSSPTFAGKMHIILSGVLTILTVLSMLLIGIWFNRAGVFPGFGTYSFITIGGPFLPGFSL